ncbi:MAG: dihydrofolate reductase [Clostridia bacterium]|nr:dihydrofolate reductase [Clostridia bacterium]
MKAIVAVDKKWGIGKDNGLLFSIPADMKFFRETTAGKVVVMGANTLKSFPNGNPLKNRTNIVLSSKIKRDDCIVINDIEKLIAEIKKYPKDDVYLIGGAMLYKTLLPYCEQALVTKVDADGGAQVFFPNLDELKEWKCAYSSESLESNDYKIKFTTYENLSVKE